MRNPLPEHSYLNEKSDNNTGNPPIPVSPFHFAPLPLMPDRPYAYMPVPRANQCLPACPALPCPICFRFRPPVFPFTSIITDPMSMVKSRGYRSYSDSSSGRCDSVPEY